MAIPRLSVILPTYNGERDLARLLPKLAAQVVEGGFEICAIDSSSSDRSRALLAAAGADVTMIPKAEFRHGPTRNRCAQRAHGELFVFLSQDVEPVDEHFLAELAAAFDDPRVAGAYARVLPRPDDDALTQRTVLELPEASEEARTCDLDVVGGVWNLAPSERAEFLRFNDVASAIRADVFRELPFPDLAFGEDFAWAARALTAGWRIRFAPRAVVWHAHRYGPRKAYERYRVDAAFHRLVHGYRVRPDLFSAARGFIYEVRQDLRFLNSRRAPRRAVDYLRSPLLRGAQVLGQYAGSRGRQSGVSG